MEQEINLTKPSNLWTYPLSFATFYAGVNENIKRGWICIRSSDVYKVAYDDDRNILFITDKQQEFFEKHKDEFNICQIADIENLLRDFGKLYKWNKDNRLE